MRVVVAGAGGFLGGHLVNALTRLGYDVMAVSRKPPARWSQHNELAKSYQIDLADPFACRRVLAGAKYVFDMAALIGGIGFLESKHADCTASVGVTSNLLRAAIEAKCERYFFPSSACIYPDTGSPDAPALKESDDRPYAPRGGYGWSKLFSEQMLMYYEQQHGLQVRIARLGTIYGPYSPIGENEKAPIAICRKVIEAKRKRARSIDIWGDGKQTRSFLYVSDCIAAIIALMWSSCNVPVNIGSSVRVSIDDLVDMVERIASVNLEHCYQLDKPQGVRGRISDTSLAEQSIAWRETTTLKRGLELTYQWVESAMP